MIITRFMLGICAVRQAVVKKRVLLGKTRKQSEIEETDH